MLQEIILIPAINFEGGNKLNIIMQRKKKISDVTEPTQPDREKRFVRQSSYHSSKGSQPSLRSLDKPPKMEPGNLNIDMGLPSPTKVHTVSMKFCRNPEDRLTPPLKASTGSMRFDFLKEQENNQQSCELQSFKKPSEAGSGEIATLQAQNRKLKLYLDEERVKRRLLEQEMLLNKQEIKRLEKRLGKYKSQREGLREEREFMLAHIQELEKDRFGPEDQKMHCYCLKAAQQEIASIRAELQRKKTQQENELLQQVQALLEQNYTLKKQLHSVSLARDSLSKQLDEADVQLQEVRAAFRQKIVHSVEYIELRERYRMLLVESKWLKEEIEHLEGLRGEGTLLTVSADSVQLDS